ncbi:MAG TPA: TadE/TadG family type IV pilus assembly protein [Candidatus Limnocylindria bacterium]|nr:TadE/TadG family type IV pilus assembly protein [Candidatus Limnocylindria bacterium]
MLFDRILRRTTPSHRRGQAMVEFAIALPLLALLLVMAVDAGRLFFGYVALHNASRIGADYAASHAEAWNGVPSPLEQSQQARYAFLVTQDLQALGCQGDPVPDPNFDPDGNGPSFADGDYVRVELECAFSPLTPLAEVFLGQPLLLRAGSDFAINHTLSAGLPPPGDPPPGPSGGPPVVCPAGEESVPDLVGMDNEDAFDAWVGAGFTGLYAPAVTNPNKNRDVLAQSLPADSCQAITASMLVTLQ